MRFYRLVLIGRRVGTVRWIFRYIFLSVISIRSIERNIFISRKFHFWIETQGPSTVSISELRRRRIWTHARRVIWILVHAFKVRKSALSTRTLFARCKIRANKKTILIAAVAVLGLVIDRAPAIWACVETVCTAINFRTGN